MRTLVPILVAACTQGQVAGDDPTDDAADADTDADADGDTDADTDSDPLGPADLLTAFPYPALRVEIDFVSGKEPDPDALDGLRDHLAELEAGGQLVKPAGVTVVL